MGADACWIVIPDENDADNATILTEKCDGEAVRRVFKAFEQDTCRENTPAKAKTNKPGWYEAYAPTHWLDVDEPVPDSPDVTVSPYGYANEATWAVNLEGELLCVTTSKVGALAVQRVVQDMGRRLAFERARRAEPIVTLRPSH